MNIEMIEYKKENPVLKGKYLVRTESTFLKTVNFFQATVVMTYNEKKQAYESSVDVKNQIVTHISKEPLLQLPNL